MRLADDRLALVQRYMIDAEEAEARARAALDKADAQARSAVEEQARRDEGRKRRSAEVLRVEAAANGRETHLPLADGADRLTSPTAKQEARARKALVNAEKRAAKEAARVAAAAEKREARERKALVKAAVKREARQRKALARPFKR
jgi:hypothetical protein